MGWRGRELRIRADAGVLLRKAFGGTGLLFLGAGPCPPRGSELSLALDTSALPMTYVLFQNRRDRVVATALRPEVLFGSGSSFHVGSRTFCFEWRDEPNDLRQRRRWLLAPALAGMAILAAAVGWHFANPSAPPPPAAPAAAASSEAPSAVLSEARKLMREGRRAEARLALIAAIEADPQDEDARHLLQAIPEGASEEAPASPEKVDHAAAAQEAFDHGRDSLRRGELEAARQEFQQARALAVAEAPLFVSEAEAALRDVEAAIQKQVAPAIARVRAILASASGAPAEAATARLIDARALAAAIGQQLPGDLQAQRLQRLVETELAAAARRWLAVAETEERLQGCRVAAPTYQRLAAALSLADPTLSALASKRADGCRP